LANNKFVGSLESLKDMTKLRRLDISGTDISGGLEYLSDSLEEINCSSGGREDAKVKNVEQILEECEVMKAENGNWLIDKQELSNKLAERLCQVAENNDIEKVGRLLEMNKEIVNLQDKYHNTALHYAASRGNLEIVDLLLKAKAKVDIKGNNGFTPLHFAVGQGHLEITLKLLEVGADPNAKEDESNTPMHFAAEGNDLKLLELLREKDGNINAKNVYDWSVLHSAASGLVRTAGTERDWDIIRWLLKERVNTNVETKSGLDVAGVFIEAGYSYVERYKELINGIRQNQEMEWEAKTMKS
jgi:hypothetical protein